MHLIESKCISVTIKRTKHPSISDSFSQQQKIEKSTITTPTTSVTAEFRFQDPETELEKTVIMMIC